MHEDEPRATVPRIGKASWWRYPMHGRDFIIRAGAAGLGAALAGRETICAGEPAASSKAAAAAQALRGEKVMKHKVVVTVLDKKVFPELQRQYCADPDAGPCPCYNVGDTFVFERGNGRDDYWHMGLNTLTKTTADPKTVAGGPAQPFCSEAWDAVSRYIYAGLQGGSIMRGWMKKENEMITCCNDGTRPVIFKIERIDEEE